VVRAIREVFRLHPLCQVKIQLTASVKNMKKSAWVLESFAYVTPDNLHHVIDEKYEAAARRWQDLLLRQGFMLYGVRGQEEEGRTVTVEYICPAPTGKTTSDYRGDGAEPLGTWNRPAHPQSRDGNQLLPRGTRRLSEIWMESPVRRCAEWAGGSGATATHPPFYLLQWQYDLTSTRGIIFFTTAVVATRDKKA